MKDFCNAADKDCIRLIVAQDLKESGIDVEPNLSGGGGGYHHRHQQSGSVSINTSINSKNSTSANIINTISGNSSCSAQQTSYFSKHANSSKNASNITAGGNTSNLNIFTAAGMVSGNESATNHHHSHSLHHHDSTHAPGRTFGVHLGQLDTVTISVNEQILSVPSFLKHSIEHITEYIHTEGIFRRNGTTARLKELRRQVEEGIYNFAQFPIFDVTSLFKLFFREMPECLLSFALYGSFIQAVKLESEKSQIDSVLNLCLQLPDANLHVLIYLMSFLHRVAEKEQLNKMNSFNLAVCFAPNIIYTRVNKGAKLQLDEEKTVVRILIEHSASIGKISDSVYERSIIFQNLSSTGATMNGVGGLAGSGNAGVLSNTCGTDGMASRLAANNAIGSVGVGIGAGGSSAMNSDIMFIYDNELPENCSFAHAAQSAGSTSLSSYCGSSTSKKEKKKRRSSSLKELMNTIQNSISKFRRRSASEKNDKTTCSIMTCTSMNNGISSVGLTFADTSCTGSTRGGNNASSSAFILMDDKDGSQSMHQATPYCGPSIHGSKQLPIMNTPICANLYATPRINKRNAEESLQSTTKKKLMEKLPQRNLLLPNAPITPFSTAKKNKHHPFKQLLSTSEAAAPSTSSSSTSSNMITSALPPMIPTNPPSALPSSAAPITSASVGQAKAAAAGGVNPSSSSSSLSASANQPSAAKSSSSSSSSTGASQSQAASAATASAPVQAPNPAALQKQLNYEDSPSSSLLSCGANQTADMISFKPKYHRDMDKVNTSDIGGEFARRRLNEMDQRSNVNYLMPSGSTVSATSSSSSSKHHHHHHHHHHSSSHRHRDRGGCSDHCHSHGHSHHGHGSSSSSSHRHSHYSHGHGHSHHHGSSSSSASGHHHGSSNCSSHCSHKHHHTAVSGSGGASSSYHGQKHKQEASTKQQQAHHHQYVNAMPGSKGHRLINQTDLCTQIISGNANLKSGSGDGVANSFLSSSSSSSSASSSSVSTPSSSKNNNAEQRAQQKAASLQNHYQHNHTSACCGVNDHKIATGAGGANLDATATNSAEDINAKQSIDDIHQRSTLLADSSMRCTLRRGRPNTPKTGLSIEYRIRKSSVPNTPETSGISGASMKHRSKINHTISNDDMKFADVSSKKSASNAVIRNLLDLDKKASLKLLKSNQPAGIAAGSRVKVETGSTESGATAAATTTAKGDALPVTTSSASLNTAMVLDEEERMLAAGAKEADDSNDARLLDMAFNEDDDDCGGSGGGDDEENVNEKHIDELENCNSIADSISGASSRSRSRSHSMSSRSSRSSSASSSSSILSQRSTPACTRSPSKIRKSTRQLSLSLTNLPTSKEEEASEPPAIVTVNIDIDAAASAGTDQKPSEVAANNDVEMDEPKETFDLPIIKLNSKSSLLQQQQQPEPVVDNSSIAKKMIEEQEKFIKFEPFEFKLPNPITEPVASAPSDVDGFKKPSSFQLMLEQQSKLLAANESSEDMLQSTLRRQSLFKLKEKINGKVSKQINEIEKRKLSPYRFFNSPLKQSKKAAKELSLASALAATQPSHAAKHVSPLRVPSIFCKKIIKSVAGQQQPATPEADKQDTHKTKPCSSKLSKTIATTTVAGSELDSPLASAKSGKLRTESPSIVRVASQFYRKFNKTRSVKRLNATMSHHHYPMQMQQPPSAALLSLATESVLLERRLLAAAAAAQSTRTDSSTPMEEEGDDKENAAATVERAVVCQQAVPSKEAGFAKIKRLDMASKCTATMEPAPEPAMAVLKPLGDANAASSLKFPPSQQHNSPTKHFNLMSTELKCTNESIDL